MYIDCNHADRIIDSNYGTTMSMVVVHMGYITAAPDVKYNYIYRTLVHQQWLYVQQNTAYLNFNHPNTSVNQAPDLCSHPSGHVALCEHYLFVSYATGMLTEQLNERTLISLTC